MSAYLAFIKKNSAAMKSAGLNFSKKYLFNFTSMNYFYVNDLKVNNIVHNQNIIDYLENIGILIPHYCYHQNLSVSGNCRMCLIELKNSPKPLVSCAMTVTNKMELYTDSPLVKKARENVLEFLLLNHPLDCPVCDQGGECDLQDQSMVFGVSRKRFFKYKRSVVNKNIGPIVKTIMTRCIHCTRCVRFTSEIAGVNDLGTFSRGNSMEIGTYISKTFQSELSGNVIDLCPVGALTSKPYTFVDRVWELKFAKSIDFADGFGVNTEVSLKSNYVVTKVAADRADGKQDNIWISDKTRFSFDGMFSPDRLSNLLYTSSHKFRKTTVINSWSVLLKELCETLYFKDHLSRQVGETLNFTVIFSSFISLENLISLFTLQQRFPFFRVVKLSDSLVKNDLTDQFVIFSAINTDQLEYSDLCILLGVNTRYEGFNLNLVLRQRFLKGNFKIFSLNSQIDLTFPVHVIGSTTACLWDIAEGNNILCSRLKNARSPILICGSNLLKRKDSLETQTILSCLARNSGITTSSEVNSWNGFNLLNTSLNETGVSNLVSLNRLSCKNSEKSDGFYMVGNCGTDSVISKLIELKSLRYFKKGVHQMILNQTSTFTNLKSKFHETNKGISYFNLPSSAFYETTGTYITTQGFSKKALKVVASKYLSKDGWQINRQLKASLGNISFLSNVRHNYTVHYMYHNFLFLTAYLNLTQSPANSLTQSYVSNLQNLTTNVVSTYKILKMKLTRSQITQWLNDFYQSGKDPYSRISKVMIECSRVLRHHSVTFKFPN